MINMRYAIIIQKETLDLHHTLYLYFCVSFNFYVSLYLSFLELSFFKLSFFNYLPAFLVSATSCLQISVEESELHS